MFESAILMLVLLVSFNGCSTCVNNKSIVHSTLVVNSFLHRFQFFQFCIVQGKIVVQCVLTHLPVEIHWERIVHVSGECLILDIGGSALCKVFPRPHTMGRLMVIEHCAGKI